MAEAADRPADQSVAASIPEAPPPAGDDAPRVYSSVSIVAIIGLVVAVLYAATVGVGGLIALFHRAPYILPLWLFAVPVGAAAVCWAARARIRASEGALTGARLTTWGVGISAVVGLLYAAYYAGCYMAVTTQATRFMDDWFDKLKNDGLEQARKYQRKADENAPLDLAFLQTLKPPRPQEDDPGPCATAWSWNTTSIRCGAAASSPTSATPSWCISSRTPAATRRSRSSASRVGATTARPATRSI